MCTERASRQYEPADVASAYWTPQKPCHIQHKRGRGDRGCGDASALQSYPGKVCHSFYVDTRLCGRPPMMSRLTERTDLRRGYRRHN